MTNPENPPANGPEVKTFTQAQVDSIAAEARRTAVAGYFKGAGLETPPTAEQVAQALQAQQAQQTEAQRIAAELEAAKGYKPQVDTLSTQLEQQRIAGTEQLPVRFWKFVEGKTEDEIKASVAGLKADLGLAPSGNQPPPAGGHQEGSQEGQPRPPAPAPQQGTGGGTPPPAKTMQAGREAYAAKHNQKD